MTRTLMLLIAMSTCGGCASLTNPVADGIPVNRLPPEALSRPKADLRPIPLTLLSHKETDQYRLDAGDILAVVANEVIAPGDQQPPVRFPDASNQVAVIGYPVPVREDGTISIPLLPPISVRGRTVQEVEKALFDAITGKNGGKELVKPAAARVSVQLFQRRMYQILVIREDSPGGSSLGAAGLGGLGGSNLFLGQQSQGGGGGGVGGGGGGKRQTGNTISLPAGENDVLHALNATGGLPGLDAKNEVVIIRGGKGYCDAADPSARTIRIPLRVYPDELVTIREEDMILQTGDVVMIEARNRDLFYTAGLIGSGVFPLPRDIDIDVLQAVALVRGPLANGSFSQTAFTSSAVSSGLGNPNASLVTILRQLPDRRQIEIRVDLNKALRDPRERILIQPGDFLVLQERPSEAITRYFTSTFRFGLGSSILRTNTSTINAAAALP